MPACNRVFFQGEGLGRADPPQEVRPPGVSERSRCAFSRKRLRERTAGATLPAMTQLPSLPVAGPLRVLAVSASLSLLAFLASAIVLLVRRRGRGAARRDEGARTQARRDEGARTQARRDEGARTQALWAAAPAGMSLVAFGLGRIAPAAHPAFAIATAALAVRNLARLRGLPRALQGVGLLSWVIAILAARALFSR